MPHIKVSENLAGIVSLFDFSPETAEPLNAIAEVLLRGHEGYSDRDREIVATYVSYLNECQFCMNTHAAMVKYLNEGDEAIVDAVKEDFESAPITEKLKAFLNIAGKVQQDARRVLTKDVERAKNAGATDKEIHDTVLIAAAFCMYNKYVDGLATVEWPEGKDKYDERAKLTAEGSYFHQKFS